MVVWIVGLSASGKTTLGRELVKQWRARDPRVVLLDGDAVREVFGHDKSADAYSLEGRRRNAERMVALCSLMDRQDLQVVCCILSVFADMRRANRTRFSRYFEIFMDTPMALLEARDPKGLYAAAKRGEAKNVAGVDIPFERPDSADLVIPGSNDPDAPARHAREILQKLGVA